MKVSCLCKADTLYMAVSGDGRFLYLLNDSAGSIPAAADNEDGVLAMQNAKCRINEKIRFGGF